MVPAKMGRPELYSFFFLTLLLNPFPRRYWAQHAQNCGCDAEPWMHSSVLQYPAMVCFSHGTWSFYILTEIYCSGGLGILSMQTLEKTKRACTSPLRTCFLRRASACTRCLQVWHGYCCPADLGQENSGWILHVFWAHKWTDIYHIISVILYHL